MVPRLSSPPALEDFLSMRPEGGPAARMVKVTGFVQRNPHDGAPVSHPTDAYLGYDDKNLYAVFVCFDDPARVRARMSRREDIFDDDTVEIMLDTFHDRRRAYVFQVTPLGVQWDAIWTEIPHTDSSGALSNFDATFDTVWDSKGKLTPQGYVVWISIPFKSLRFSLAQRQDWGIILYRQIYRESEDAFWPAVSRRLEGRLDRAATLKGLSGISPGRNMQFIPYAALRSFQALDTTDPATAVFTNRDAEFRGGLDSKFIFHDNFVLDLTANPDFSQVESDEPQITVNQRYEVFFPEKRPFFLENADFFKTPFNLFFTRRIGDPQFGARLTGKAGPYSVGLLAIDDRAPGKSVLPTDPGYDDRGTFVIGRVSRDLFGQSSLGLIYTDREFPGGDEFNRVGGFDGRFKFNPNWTGLFQAVASSTQDGSGNQTGSAFRAEGTYTGNSFFYDSTYNDISPGFNTEAGFVNRVDLREIRNNLDYRFHPEKGLVTSWGPTLFTSHVWAHDGTRLDTYYSPVFAIYMKAQSYIYLYPYVNYRERLRPQDFASLPPSGQDYHEHFSAIGLGSSYLRKLTIQGYYQYGDAINFVPADIVPVLARSDSGNVLVSVRPFNALKIDNTYLFDRVRDRASPRAVFNNHIARSKWNWQLNRQLSLRLIFQYNATLTNPSLTFLPTSKQFNADFLITYLVHPGTAIYAGYNSDLQNLDLDSGNLTRTRNDYLNDGRQFFVKVSYLFRF